MGLKIIRCIRYLAGLKVLSKMIWFSVLRDLVSRINGCVVGTNDKLVQNPFYRTERWQKQVNLSITFYFKPLKLLITGEIASKSGARCSSHLSLAQSSIK